MLAHLFCPTLQWWKSGVSQALGPAPAAEVYLSSRVPCSIALQGAITCKTQPPWACSIFNTEAKSHLS